MVLKMEFLAKKSKRVERLIEQFAQILFFWYTPVNYSGTVRQRFENGA